MQSTVNKNTNYCAINTIGSSGKSALPLNKS
jgi:hypothetical protein